MGHRITTSDIVIKRDFKAPPGTKPGSMDAAGDGDVLVVLDLEVDEGLLKAGMAREMVNRYQKLRKQVRERAVYAQVSVPCTDK